MATAPAPEEPARPRGLLLARVMGVPVYLSPSWLLFAVFILASYGPQLSRAVGPTRGYVAAASYALLLLLSVLLHELGHCVVARLYGLPVRSITVTLLAGMTEITKSPQTAAREYSVAVAGPMVSLLLSACGFAGLQLFEPASLPRLIAEGVALTNGLVAVFNLLPGLPLDGGRVLRSVVWRVTGDPERSTRYAAWAGRGVAVVVPLLLLVGLPAAGFTNPTVPAVLFAALISSFIYLGASAALRASQVAGRLPAVTVARLARPALRVPADLPLAEALRRAREAGAGGLVVVDSAGRPESLVSEAAVVATPEPRRPWVLVGSLGRSLESGLRVDPGLAGEELLAALRATPATEYLVEDPDGGVRVLAASDVGAAVAGSLPRP